MFAMALRRSGKPRSQPDWVRMAELYDHHLTSAEPIWGDCGDAEPSDLEVHVHRGLDVGILLREGYELRYGDYAFTPRRGDVWLGGMWEPHSWRVTRPGARSVILCFLPEVLEEHIEPELDLLRVFTLPASQRPRVTSAQMRREVLVIGRRMCQELRGMKRGWRAMIKLQLVELLVTLMRDWEFPRSLQRSGTLRSDELARIIPALALVHASAGGRVSARAAADACRLSVSGFQHSFQRTMGMSYGRFTLRSRLALVAHALLDADLPVQAIAERTGFVDASHLHRQFVAHYRCTPAEYRRRVRQG
ncbi:MAG: helix-turn-helix domain-containing protein [Armatimonadota bacterium]